MLKTSPWPATFTGSNLVVKQSHERRSAKPTKNGMPPKRKGYGRKQNQRKTTSERAPSQRKWQNTHRGARTHDHKVKGLALCRLS